MLLVGPWGARALHAAEGITGARAAPRAARSPLPSGLAAWGAPLVLVYFAGERQQRDIAGPLDRSPEHALMQRAETGVAARQDLAPVTDELFQRFYILVVNVVDLIDAEEVHLAAAEKAAAILRRS